MSSTPEPEEKIVRYLLGQLPEEERAQIEERLLLEDDFENEVQAVRDDLLQGYVKNTLPLELRARVETQLLQAPGQRERLAFIRDLLTVSERVGRGEGRRKRKAWAAWARAAAAIVAVASVGVWIASRNGAPPPPPENAHEGTLPSPPAPRDVDGSEAPAPATPPLVRVPAASSSPVDIVADGRFEAVHLLVPITVSRPSFNAVLRAGTGRVIWRANGLVASAGAIALDVPVRLLATADYTLAVVTDPLRDGAAPPPVLLEYHLRVRRAP
jgi:hypothetical protein